MPPEDLADEASSPSLPPEILLYIKHIDDTVANYRRFFDSLLVKRPDHETFFQDLRYFREQEDIINLLTTTNVDGSGLKELYRQCTRQFLASRFAHPWCRNEYGTARSGFLNTARSKQKQVEARQREEDRFHKLLVPIWIPFRRRMMPTEAELAQFLTDFETKKPERQRKLAERQHESNDIKPLTFAIAKEADHTGEASTVDKTHDGKSTSFNAEAFVSEDDDLVHVPDERHQGSEQAAQLFIGVAAASFLASNKRARKYVMRKMKK